MLKKKLYLIIWLSAICTTIINSQVIERPNYSLNSHPTLEILKVEMTVEKTVFYMSIENRIAGGNFCADRNIYVINPGGERIKLNRAAGIPTCPDSYKFKNIGEKLLFTLEFPPLGSEIKWIDIVEECNENCFSFYGVTLNTELNTKINLALSLAEEGGKSSAIALYKTIIESLTSTDIGIKGALYSDIITLSLEAGDKTGAAEWYKKMLSSDAPRLELFVKNLNSRGIRF
jgi:hypothetical protein